MGYPSNLEEAIFLENNFFEIDYILNFEASPETCLKRLLSKPGNTETSEEITKRLEIYETKTNEF